MKKVCAFIFARGGSKGLPNKNILPIGGIPLICHSIETARKVKSIDSIFVSTDSQDIADIASAAGAIVIKRPKQLATDSSPEWISWQHAINEVKSHYTPFDTFLSLPATSPLRAREDVENCLNALKHEIDIVVTMTNAKRNPWFNMVSTSKESKRVELLLSDKNITRRQEAPDCFDLTTVAYAGNPDFILNANSIWEGKVAGVLVPEERAIDIDNKIDYLIAKFIYENNLHLTANCEN